MKYFVPVFFLSSCLTAFSQQNYWQQQADYKIEVSLNDVKHELDGFMTVDYRNNSPETLGFIWFHLWANAYRDQGTPMAKQMLENGKTKFWWSKPEQRGYIDSLSFKADAEVCRWSHEPGSEEMCKVFLNRPLKSGESVRISTPFHVKLPETFSRMGHVGQSYQITQWYPKPAVLDKYGWHPMPYLDQGEFYSEFGSFDVSITLPENYVVGATGDLQDSSEMEWMDAKAEMNLKMGGFGNKGDMNFPASAKETKTLHYKQKNVHDFAWFADKRYHVLKGEVRLPNSDRKVTTWVLFTNNQAKWWAKATEYVNDAVYYYSRWVGEYPYNQATAVDGTISAGSGMEYPNITVIGEEKSEFRLDEVITHEVGHNWFYGMLGTNECEHAWMDEGINSYYEYRYTLRKYPNRKMVGEFPEELARLFDVNQYQHKYLNDLAYQFMARENLDQPIELPSDKFTVFNYGVEVYGKTMLLFDYLESYLGTEVFDRAMKKYFETWKYRHPQPEDIRKMFETETGKNLNWFFDDLIKTSKKVDYKICGSQLTVGSTTSLVSIKNVGDISSPVSVSVLKKDSVLRTVWVDGFEGKKIIEINVGGGDKIQIDPQLVIPEINRKNNIYKLNRIAHKFKKLRLQFLGSIENQNRSQIFFAPYLAWNNYDKTQVGLAFYNPYIPARKFNYLFVPAFGTGSKQFIGFARMNYNFHPEKVQSITIGISGKRFSYLLFPTNQTINKIEPYLNIELKKKNSRSAYTHSINIRSANIWLDLMNPNENGKKERQHYFVNELRYKLESNTALNPFSIQTTFQHGRNFGNISAEGNFMISYKRKNEGFKVRLFAGAFLFNTRSGTDVVTAPDPRFYLSNATSNTYTYWLQKDYMFDENFIDRNGRDRNLGRQVTNTGGGFRSMSTFGSSRKFLASSNFSSSIYKFVPIQPFASVAVVMNDFNKIDFAAEGGLSLVIIRNVAEIHLPFLATQNITDGQQGLGITKWYQRITFTLKLQLKKPMDIIRQFGGL